MFFYLVKNLETITFKINFNDDSKEYSVSKQDFYKKYPNLAKEHSLDKYVNELKKISKKDKLGI
ncbi:hypothetical protein, partial [Priestia megaterium]|uniref:hypothetical protein n=1 Tax=Priestia megaterium TaxID=1404 RepID=UPI0031017E0B